MNLKFGVPCSRIKDKIQDVDINCTSEEEAMGIAFGCKLAGQEPQVYMQNSGVGRIGDICLSLYAPYHMKLPKLILSIRHFPYHHSFMGARTLQLLHLFGYTIDSVDITEQKEIE